MDAPTRRTRFEERVRVEREFLVPINQRFGKVAPLAGMTSEAIESWRFRAAGAGVDLDIEGAAALLREASARAELLADNSRDVFEADRRTGPDGISDLRRMLEELLAS